MIVRRIRGLRTSSAVLQIANKGFVPRRSSDTCVFYPGRRENRKMEYSVLLTENWFTLEILSTVMYWIRGQSTSLRATRLRCVFIVDRAVSVHIELAPPSKNSPASIGATTAEVEEQATEKGAVGGSDLRYRWESLRELTLTPLDACLSVQCQSRQLRKR